jgi:hypothetical protein
VTWPDPAEFTERAETLLAVAECNRRANEPSAQAPPDHTAAATDEPSAPAVDWSGEFEHKPEP